MINRLLSQGKVNAAQCHEEGELFKRIKLRGVDFEIRYGYYEKGERDNAITDPMPIYPDFIKYPQYTEDGFPFVTMMQDVCEHYVGEEQRDCDCSECVHFERGNELIGICTCLSRRKAE